MSTLNEEQLTVLRAEMAKENISQANLAELLGISKQALGGILKGKHNVFSDQFAKVLEYFDLEVTLTPKQKS